MNYEKDFRLLEDLTDEQLAEVSQYTVPFDVQSVDNIKKMFKEKRGKKTPLGKKALVAALASAVLVSVGFTQYDEIRTTFRSTMYKIFSGNIDGIMNAGSEMRQTVSDNGIVLETMYSLKDDKTSYLFFTLQDVDGDRVDNYIDMPTINFENGHLKTMRRAFDFNTKKLTVAMEYYNEQSIKNNVMTIKNMYTDFRKVETPITSIDLFKLVKKADAKFYDGDDYPFPDEGVTEPTSITSYNTAKETSYLVSTSVSMDTGSAEQMPHTSTKIAPMAKWFQLDEFKGIYFSSIGWENGNLHVLLERENVDDLSVRQINLSLMNNKTKLKTNYSQHTEYNGKFIEYIFPLQSIDDLKEYSLFAEAFVYDTMIAGEWSVSFPEATATEPVVLGKELVGVADDKEFVIKQLTASALSLNMKISNVDDKFVNYIFHSNVMKLPNAKPKEYIIYDDGSILYSMGMSSSMNETGDCEFTINFEGAIEPEKIAGVMFGDEVIVVK